MFSNWIGANQEKQIDIVCVCIYNDRNVITHRSWMQPLKLPNRHCDGIRTTIYPINQMVCSPKLAAFCGNGWKMKFICENQLVLIGLLCCPLNVRKTVGKKWGEMGGRKEWRSMTLSLRQMAKISLEKLLTCRRHMRISYLMNVSTKMFLNPMAPRYSMDAVLNGRFQWIDVAF